LSAVFPAVAHFAARTATISPILERNAACGMLSMLAYLDLGAQHSCGLMCPVILLARQR
jgi:hypothetical protein